MQSITIYVSKDSKECEQKTFEADQTVDIGRSGDNNLHLDDKMVSRKHASITWSDGSWVFVDNGSKNGTIVNGEKIVTKTLCDGDIIFIYPFEINIKINNTDVSETTNNSLNKTQVISCINQENNQPNKTRIVNINDLNTYSKCGDKTDIKNRKYFFIFILSLTISGAIAYYFINNNKKESFLQKKNTVKLQSMIGSSGVKTVKDPEKLKVDKKHIRSMLRDGDYAVALNRIHRVLADFPDDVELKEFQKECDKKIAQQKALAAEQKRKEELTRAEILRQLDQAKKYLDEKAYQSALRVADDLIKKTRAIGFGDMEERVTEFAAQVADAEKAQKREAEVIRQRNARFLTQYNQARDYYEKGKYAEARQLLKDLIASKYRHPKFDQATRNYQKITNYINSEIDRYLKDAEHCREKDDNPCILAKMDAALRLDPDNGPAKVQYSEVLSKQETIARAYYEKAYALTSEGFTGEAEHLYRKIITILPLPTHPLYLKAQKGLRKIQ